MPRLLLVDDNPSIHRIAESLLAPTDVELVCVDSAAEALDRIERGDRFDVALVDTAMPGMDGWTLLARFRDMEATARMPIALMAGVLDPVDPAKLAKAPIQGFLKKPIELRELGDRVKALVATPVVLKPSPFSTVPATPAKDLVKRAEAALPELRPDPLAEPLAEPAAPPVGDAGRALVLPEPEDDLLVLTAEDLWPEEDALAVAPGVELPSALPDVHLELEELDLESLQDLGSEPLPPELPVPEPADLLPAGEGDDHLVTLSGLEDLDALSTDFDFPADAVPVAAPLDDAFADLPLAASLIGGGEPEPPRVFSGALPEPDDESPWMAPLPEPAFPEPVFEPVAEVALVPAVSAPVESESVPAAGGQMAAVAGHVPASASGPVSPEQAQALVQALLADPVLVDALVKAVVARMGDQVLREIAWEVMPDLAGRLHS